MGQTNLQGTVWPWLTGAFVEAWVRTHGGDAAARREARLHFLKPLLARLDAAGLGHISEIADGDAPHAPRGCPFQAWSVGEALRLDRVVLAEPPAKSSREENQATGTRQRIKPMKATATTKKRILILGGGFAGAYVALHLEKRLAGNSDVEIALVSKENFVLFTPMLHEVAGSDVAVTDIVQPLRKMLRHTRVAIANIEAIDLVKKQVRIAHADLPEPIDVTYDQLVLALGAVTNFFNTPGLAEHALTMKTLGDAILVRNRVIDALELADNQRADADARKMTLTAVVAGGGFAGVETVGAVNDFLREGMEFYRDLKEDMLRMVLVHPGEVILPELGESLGRYAQKKLAERGVEIRVKTKVTGFNGHEVALDDGTKIATRMLIWTAGTTPSPLLSSLPCALQRGRVVADECLQVTGWPGVWALGDCALVPDPYNPGKFYPPTAQHATRQAAVLADNIVAVMHGQSPRPFKFKILGLLAAIGRRTGVAEIFGMKFSGIIAWWLWRGIYLSKLPGLQKKVRVALDWALDLIFSKDIVQLPTLRSPTISEAEVTSSPTSGTTPAVTAAPKS